MTHRERWLACLLLGHSQEDHGSPTVSLSGACKVCILLSGTPRCAEMGQLTCFLLRHLQDDHGNPIVSPSGKYTIRFLLNGTLRGIEIDDLLPFRPGASPPELLCSHCVGSNEMWLSLFEKVSASLPQSHLHTDTYSASPPRHICYRCVESYEMWLSVSMKGYLLVLHSLMCTLTHAMPVLPGISAIAVWDLMKCGSLSL